MKQTRKWRESSHFSSSQGVGLSPLEGAGGFGLWMWANDDWGWFIEPIYCDFGDSLWMLMALVLPH